MVHFSDVDTKTTYARLKRDLLRMKIWHLLCYLQQLKKSRLGQPPPPYKNLAHKSNISGPRHLIFYLRADIFLLKHVQER